MFTQLVTPSLNVKYEGGWCEQGAERTVGIDGVYTSAMVACRANVMHTGTPPKGFYVPIYLDLPNGPRDANGTQGDVAIWCPDGTVAACAMAGNNTGLFKYPSLQAYIDDYSRNNNGANYLGWGEYIGKIKVIQGDDMRAISKEEVYWNYVLIAGVIPTDAEVQAYVGQDYVTVTEQMKQYFANHHTAFMDYRQATDAQIADYKAQLAVKVATPVVTTTEAPTPESTPVVDTPIVSAVPNVPNDTTNLNALGLALQWIIKRLGLK